MAPGEIPLPSLRSSPVYKGGIFAFPALEGMERTGKERTGGGFREDKREEEMKEWVLDILKNSPIKKNYFLMELGIPPSFPLPQPGQFVHVKVGEYPEFLLRRPFSIFDLDRERGVLKIFYRVVGRGTGALSRKKEGEKISLLGPLGRGFPPGKGEIILVGGGMGLASLHLLGKRAGEEGKRVISFLGFRKGEEVVMVERFSLFSDRVVVSTENGKMGEKGKITEFLERERFTPSSTLYACGPLPMFKELKKIAQRENLTCWVSMEEFMGCGLGICQGCVIPTDKGYERICQEGPVFPLSRLRW